MKVKFIAFCCLAFLCFSCEVKLENNTRILVEGIVLDQNNSPISEAEIYVSTQTGGGYFGGGENEYIIGEGLSKSDGSFSLVSFYDKDEDFAIEINAGDAYSKYIYKTNTTDYTPLDYSFNLETVNLKEIANFSLNIERTSNEDNTLSFSVVYNEPFCYEVYDGLTLDENQSYCFVECTENRNLNNENPNFEDNWRVPLGETVTFIYSINDEPEITEIITINQGNYEFTFNY